MFNTSAANLVFILAFNSMFAARLGWLLLGERPAPATLIKMVIVPGAFWCLATGPKYITGPEVGMYYLLEMLLTPVWVWLIFNAAVPGRKLVGGTIIIVSLLVHSIVRLRSASRRKTAAAIRRV